MDPVPMHCNRLILTVSEPFASMDCKLIQMINYKLYCYLINIRDGAVYAHLFHEIENYDTLQRQLLYLSFRLRL